MDFSINGSNGSTPRPETAGNIAKQETGSSTPSESSIFSSSGTVASAGSGSISSGSYFA